MNKGFKTGIFALALIALASCGSDDEVTEGVIDTADVKGEIDLMGAEGGSLNYNYNGNEYKAYEVELNDSAVLRIFPNNVTFEMAKEEVHTKIKGPFSNIEIISTEGDCIYYKEVKRPFGGDGEERTGYGFIRVVKKDAKTNYQIESGGALMDPIWNKADADKLLKIAKSFKPKS
ncbi:MAG: hypothetical protein ACJASQ_002045 [Crocinitomicaceae bacterium]|jgi:hypothetical protein